LNSANSGGVYSGSLNSANSGGLGSGGFGSLNSRPVAIEIVEITSSSSESSNEEFSPAQVPILKRKRDYLAKREKELQDSMEGVISTCPTCTFQNKLDAKQCEMCRTPLRVSLESNRYNVSEFSDEGHENALLSDKEAKDGLVCDVFGKAIVYERGADFLSPVEQAKRLNAKVDVARLSHAAPIMPEGGTKFLIRLDSIKNVKDIFYDSEGRWSWSSVRQHGDVEYKETRELTTVTTCAEVKAYIRNKKTTGQAKCGICLRCQGIEANSHPTFTK